MAGPHRRKARLRREHVRAQLVNGAVLDELCRGSVAARARVAAARRHDRAGADVFSVVLARGLQQVPMPRLHANGCA